MPTKKSNTTKKTTAKKVAPKKTASKKAATKKTSTAKKSTAKKAPVKKTTAKKKAAPKKATAKKAAPKKSTSKTTTKKTMYSNDELKAFKELLEAKLHSAQAELKYYQDEISKSSEQVSEGKYLSLEDGAGTLEKEQLNQMASRQKKFIQHLKNALIRIENKTYGVCRETGELISKERLLAVPHATLSIKAKLAK